MSVEYISKKIPRESDGLIKYVQAHYQLEKGQRVTESEVIVMAIEHIAEEKYGYHKTVKKLKKYRFIDMVGTIKSIKKSSPGEIDKVVYGI